MRTSFIDIIENSTNRFCDNMITEFSCNGNSIQIKNETHNNLNGKK